MPRLRSLLSFGLWAPLAAAFAAPAPGTRDRVETHFEPTAVALGATAWDLPGSSLREDTLAYSVELSLAPALTLWRAALPGPLEGAWRVVGVPKMVVRRSDGLPSNPVRTPDYHPAVALYVEPRGALYYSFEVAHHSNGQAGPFLRPDGGVNDVDGSFSLWSQTVGVHRVNPEAWLPEYAALRVRRVSHKEAELDALYPDWTVSLSLHTADRAHALGFLGGRSRLTADLEWLPAPEENLPGARGPAPWRAAVAARYAPDLRQDASRGPWSGFAFFARFRAGSDAYNIRFGREVYRLDVGLMAGPGT